MQPLVSVVCPVRDGGAFLRDSVVSILRQSYENIELILVDDHSTDGAVDALDVRDPRLKIMRSSRRGVSHAFNAGLAESRGRFVARMDADDIAMERRIEKQLALFLDDPGLGIAGACVDFFSAERVRQGNRVYSDWLNALREPEAIRRAMFIESPIPNPTAMFRRDVIDRLGGYRHPDWPEDYDLFLRAHAHGVRMAKPAEVLLRWRDHPGRLTRTDLRYSLENFQRAKAHYLARFEWPDRRRVIWGAGATGKLTHDLLRAEGVDVDGFIEVHPRRIGGRKRQKPVWDRSAALRSGIFILVAVGARGARDRIRDFLEQHGKVEGNDFLCVA